MEIPKEPWELPWKGMSTTANPNDPFFIGEAAFAQQFSL
jgi:hypothetical protein